MNKDNHMGYSNVTKYQTSAHKLFNTIFAEKRNYFLTYIFSLHQIRIEELRDIFETLEKVVFMIREIKTIACSIIFRRFCKDSYKEMDIQQHLFGRSSAVDKSDCWLRILKVQHGSSEMCPRCHTFWHQCHSGFCPNSIMHCTVVSLF